MATGRRLEPFTASWQADGPPTIGHALTHTEAQQTTCEERSPTSGVHEPARGRRGGTPHPKRRACGYLPRNLADLANPPKARRARSRNARDHCWTREQLVAFLDHTRTSGDRLHPLWFVIATTGLRRAEALALRWSDLELDRARLTIRQTVTIANGVVVWQRDAKSDDSERTIALDTRTIAVLNDHHTRQDQERRAAGVPIKVVSERIGHADPAVTMQVYAHAHALEGDDATAAAIFDDR